jgi:hypothetical protein
VVNAVRLLQQHPKLRPVEAVSTIGLGLRRQKAGQFVLVYSYFEPSSTEPCGLVSVRAIRHERHEDVFFGVRESSQAGTAQESSFLILE